MASKKPVILFVEDDKEVLSINKRYLSSQGYKVLTAESVSEAIRVFLSNWQSIDLVILDIQLPDDNQGGLMLAKFIRQKMTAIQMQRLGFEVEPKFDFTGEILIISGDISPVIAEKFQRYDIAGYLLKPMKAEDLEIAVQTCLRKMESSPTNNGNYSILYEWGDSEKMIRQLIQDADGNIRKSGFLRRRGKLSICIPVVTGRCRFACSFCSHTYAPKGSTRKETAEDMVNIVNTALSQSLFKPLDEDEPFEVAFAGEGDPGQNLTNTIRAIHLLCHEYGKQLSKIVISTVNAFVIERLLEEDFHCPVQLQCSITFLGADRKKYMPISSSIKDMLTMSVKYHQASQLPVLLNYILIAGKTDSASKINGLIRLIAKYGTECFKVKLSNFNPIEELDWEPSEGRAKDIKSELDSYEIDCIHFRTPSRKFLRIPADRELSN